MAGGGSAYTRLEKPDNSISQGLQFWGQQAAQERQNNKLLKEREQIRQDKKEEEFDKNFGSLEEFRNKLSGFKTYDQIGADYTTKVRDEYVKEYNRASEALRTGNAQERKDAEMRMRTLKGTFVQVNDMTDRFAKLFEEYKNKTNISGVDADWQNKIQSVLVDNKFEIVPDKNGNPLIKGIFKNKKGEDELFEVNYQELMDGSFRSYDRQEIRGKGGLVEKVLTNLGSYEEIKEKGLITTTSKLWNDNIEKAVEVHLDTMIGNDEIVADILNQLDSTSTKKKGFSDDEKEKVRKVLYSAIRGGYDEKYSEQFNKDRGAYITANRKISADERHNKVMEGIARKNAETAAKAAETGMINALANKKKIEHDINKEDEIGKGIVTISQPFKDGNSTYRTFNISDKDEKGKESLLPFVSYVDSQGKPVNISSVDIDTKTGNMRYKDGRGKLQTISAEKDYNLYNTIWNQIEGREERNSSNGGVSSSNNDPLNLGF